VKGSQIHLGHRWPQEDGRWLSNIEVYETWWPSCTLRIYAYVNFIRQSALPFRHAIRLAPAIAGKSGFTTAIKPASKKAVYTTAELSVSTKPPANRKLNLTTNVTLSYQYPQSLMCTCERLPEIAHFHICVHAHKNAYEQVSNCGKTLAVVCC
jgi:hypothetical protein